jgi:deoxyribodipyrimidine photolyase-related protein
MSATVRNLVIVLGDQLDHDNAALKDFDQSLDRVWMAEVREESEHVWSHKARITLFLSAMRHFRRELDQAGRAVVYHQLGKHAFDTLSQALRADIARLRPQRLVMTPAGDHRVQRAINEVTGEAGISLEVRPDNHFLCSQQAFDDWADTRKQLRLESFYREMRKRSDILMDANQPAGGQWNYDKANRRQFGQEGPGMLPPWPAFPPDPITRGVIRDVADAFPDHPGSLENFDWPVTRADALVALGDFVTHRLASFGPFQDAMWTGEPFLYHSALASALNLKLLRPLEVIEAAVEAWRGGRAPINSVEGFVRQILGWREYVRGIYWREMPDYLTRNALNARQPLPGFYWTGDTEMNCLHHSIRQTLDYGYAHHIQRLMVTGLFALLLGVEPRRLHEWYLAVYVDAVEWVEAPNTIGMSQYADGGLLASKPYVATGKYIKRMSNYCSRCRFNPDNATGDDACPFTTLYWDFLQRHQSRFVKHPRTALQWNNLGRLSQQDRDLISTQAKRIRHRCEQ